MVAKMEGINDFKTPNKLSEKRKSGKIAEVRPFLVAVSTRKVLVFAPCHC